MDKENITRSEEKQFFPKWVYKFGWGAVAFFTIKGLVWLAVIFGLGKWIGC